MRTEVKRADLVAYGNNNDIINIEAKNVNPNWFTLSNGAITIRHNDLIVRVKKDIKKLCQLSDKESNNVNNMILFWVLTIKDTKNIRPYKDNKYDSFGRVKAMNKHPISLDTHSEQIIKFRNAIAREFPCIAHLRQIKIKSDSKYYQYYALIGFCPSAEGLCQSDKNWDATGKNCEVPCEQCPCAQEDSAAEGQAKY